MKSRVNIIEKHAIRSWRHRFEQWYVIDFHPLARTKERERERKLFLPRTTMALKARNIVTRTGFHWDNDAFRNTEDGYVSGKWSHARHSRLIAAKLARLSTIRSNFRNFLFQTAGCSCFALRPNHGLECCWGMRS